MHIFQVTIATTNTPQPIVAAAVVPDRINPFQQIVLQNNGGSIMRVGDSGVTANKGIKILAGGSLNITPQMQYSGDVSEFWVNGTAADVLDVMVLD